MEVWAVVLDAGRRERWLEKRLRRMEEVEALVKGGGAVELLGAGGTMVFYGRGTSSQQLRVKNSAEGNALVRVVECFNLDWYSGSAKFVYFVDSHGFDNFATQARRLVKAH